MTPTITTAETAGKAKNVLKDLAEQLRTQDNACTADPIYLVQRKNRLYGFDPDYTEDVVWLDVGNDCSEASPEQVVQLNGMRSNGDPIPEEWTRTGYLDQWDFVQPFLTRRAAEEYIAAQKHNLGEARVYVASAYRNQEWQFIRKHFSRTETP